MASTVGAVVVAGVDGSTLAGPWSLPVAETGDGSLTTATTGEVETSVGDVAASCGAASVVVTAGGVPAAVSWGSGAPIWSACAAADWSSGATVDVPVSAGASSGPGPGVAGSDWAAVSAASVGVASLVAAGSPSYGSGVGATVTVGASSGAIGSTAGAVGATRSSVAVVGATTSSGAVTSPGAGGRSVVTAPVLSLTSSCAGAALESGAIAIASSARALVALANATTAAQIPMSATRPVRGFDGLSTESDLGFAGVALGVYPPQLSAGTDCFP